ncbi:MAG TPA: PQQ-binding-like beta-propeller repeat protein [Planctomycetaceae bacterium]
MTAEPVAPSSARRVRWLPGVILLVLAPFCIVATWYVSGALADWDRTVQMVAGIVALSLAVLIQAVWWLGFARLSWRGRVIGVLAVAAVAGAAAACVRIDGHRGEMLPIFAFRWEPTPEEQAIAYFRAAESNAATVGRPDAAELVTVTDGDWPQYRGPGRDGVAADAAIRTDWEADPPEVVWRHPVGPGWSSFAVVGDRAYTQEQRGEQEVVVCYDADTGDQRWVHADAARFSESLGGDGPRATPTVADGAVYALGATGLLNCLDAATGSPRWQRDILRDAGDGERVANIDWGMAGSPVVWEGKVYVAPGGEKGKGVIAYDAADGEIVWASGGSPASYAAPRVETIGGVPHLLVFDGAGLKGYAPATGDVLWSFGPWTNQPKVNAAQPIVQGDRVFLSSGYTVGSALLEVKKSGDGWTVDEVWRNDNEFKLKFNDAVLHDGRLYGLDEGILACYDFATGERRWKKGRYGYGQIVLLGDVLVILAEDGSLAAVKASPEKYEELARVPVLEGKTWNHPAFARGLLYVRNDREAACLDLRPR